MIGTALGPYRIETELGSGGMGKVFAAVVEGRCPGLDTGARVALKVVHPHLLEQPGFFRRFLREAEIGASVRHPNVVRTHLADAIGHEHFLVMEYVEGQTLRELLDELERVPEELCRLIGREVAKGLAAIHAAGVVHRDIKPENVLITAEHEVKVMDLGVARLQDEVVRLSQTGAFVGSLHYAAPEAFKDGGEDLDGRADLHALGLVLYELACGVNPYLADDLPKTVHKVLHVEPRRLGDANPQLSPFFEEVVHCLLAKDRDARFASAGKLLDVLKAGEESTWWNQRASLIRRDTKRPLRRSRIPRETAVYGRDEELVRLSALFKQAKSGDGQVVLIEGEAGIGKSRLVDELIGRLQSDGEDLNFLFGSYPPGGAALAAGGFSSAYREQFGADGSEPYLQKTPLLVPGFDAVLRGEPPREEAHGLTKDSLQTCFVHVTRALAAERPTVVLIDDLHFAPEDARALFTSLALAVPGHRVLLLGTTRPGVPEEWISHLTRPEHVSHMQVGRLGPKDLAALLKDSFRSERLAHELGMRIGEKSDGNPFFIFEIIRGLREGQFIARKDDGTWVTTRVIDDIQIPSSVLDLVNARVADLTQEERDVLDVAACWGFEFDPMLVGEVVGLARIPLLKTLSLTERKHRLVRSAGQRFVFDHHQVQEALYAGLPELLRESYHAALAEALETRTKAAEADPATLDGSLCMDLCEHYLKGARGEAALRYLEAAQTHLLKGHLHAQSAALAERALGVPELLSGRERVRTLLRLCQANGPLDMLGKRERQEEAARESERLVGDLGDEEMRGKAASALGNVLFRTSRNEEAESAFGRTLEIARARGDHRAEASTANSLGYLLRRRGRLKDARESHERSLALSRELGDRLCEAMASNGLATLLLEQGRFTDAQEHQERSLVLARELGDRRGEAVFTGNLGNALFDQGRLTQAMEHQKRSLVLSREIGDRMSEANATGNLGLVFRVQGRPTQALDHQKRSLELAREIGDRIREAVALVNLGPPWLDLGNLRRAHEAFEASLSLCGEIGVRYPEGYALFGLGTVAKEEGDTARALDWCATSLALRRDIGHGDGIADTLILVGDLHRHSGETESAREALEEAVTLVRELGDDRRLVMALASLACLPGGDIEAALEALAAAGDAGDSLHVRQSLWQATGDGVHLAGAKRLLDEALAKVPVEYHESMCTNVSLHREILAACKEHGL